MRVADLLVLRLARAGARAIFGLPGGGSNLDIIEAARQQGLRFVLAHTETAGALMAAAQGEITGAPGVCLSTLGPVIDTFGEARLADAAISRLASRVVMRLDEEIGQGAPSLTQAQVTRSSRRPPCPDRPRKRRARLSRARRRATSWMRSSAPAPRAPSRARRSSRR
ncbi:MAG: thiamine pyrophosphate-binding protein [Vicinamibacterales bacterium]